MKLLIVLQRRDLKHDPASATSITVSITDINIANMIDK